ncbi:coiled-coil domain-containing 58 isoform X1 [Megachile rotundata]|uniref:coiled-coil domain-containing 58 isoform X1 n=2 Tax=Megachile rotundata TaxID=143995 RepID=UPI000258F304|nr:PREDICTED: coiled-coil domain-containing protein 58 isoform X1 [Megachile rotundata]XP_012148362.1 PREDICTED: coiled-coil domain-containing protein 58 isoform X1 [Megachile rotundata]
MAALGAECGDFLEFQDALQKMRQIDDKIIYMLNAIIPTESFKSQVDPKAQCKELFEQIQSGHKEREMAITRCLNASKEKVQQLKAQRDNGDDSLQLLKTLRKEQNTLRLLQSELGVEEIVKKRTVDVYQEKCRSFYKPINIKS